MRLSKNATDAVERIFRRVAGNDDVIDLAEFVAAAGDRESGLDVGTHAEGAFRLTAALPRQLAEIEALLGNVPALDAHLAKRGPGGPPAGGPSQEGNTGLPPLVKRDGDGASPMVSFEQFLGLADLLMAGDIEERGAVLFHMYDMDASGALSPDEAKSVWEHLCRIGAKVASGNGDVSTKVVTSATSSDDWAERTWKCLAPEGDMNLEDFLAIMHKLVRSIQIGYGLALQTGVVDAQGNLLADEDSHNQVHPEHLRFDEGEYMALSERIADAAQKAKCPPDSLNQRAVQELFGRSLPTPELCESVYGILDADKSGSVSKAEVLAQLDTLLKGSVEERVGAIFQLYDMDRSGQLDAKEDQHAVQDGLRSDKRMASLADEQLSLDVIALLVRIADVDGNGTLSLEEVTRVASSFMRSSVGAVGLLPTSLIFGAEDRKHPMDAKPRAAIGFIALSILSVIIFNTLMDGPGLQGPLYVEEFGWTFQQVAFLSIIFQASGIPGNFAGGFVIDFIGSGLSHVICNVFMVISAILQVAATSGSGSYVVYVISRIFLGLGKTVFATNAVQLSCLVAPRFVTVVGAIAMAGRMGIFVVSRTVFVNLSLAAYNSMIVIISIVALAFSLLVLVFGPRAGFALGKPKKDQFNQSLHGTWSAAVASVTPGVKFGLIGRLPRMFWLNLIAVCAYNGVVFSYSSLGTFWFIDLDGDTLAQANAKVNVQNLSLLILTIPTGMFANKFGYRIHILFVSFIFPAAALLLLAIIDGFNTWAFAIIYGSVWGSIAALVFSLLPLYEPNKALHGTAFGILMSISSLAVVILTSVAAAMQSSPLPGLDFARSGALVWGIVAAIAIPVTFIMLVMDRKPRNMVAGAKELSRRSESANEGKQLTAIAF